MHPDEKWIKECADEVGDVTIEVDRHLDMIVVIDNEDRQGDIILDGDIVLDGETAEELIAQYDEIWQDYEGDPDDIWKYLVRDWILCCWC